MTDRNDYLNRIRTIEEFLYEEASYLDRPDLDKWIELYTEDGTYWMPATEDQEDPVNHISLFYDDRVMMEIRRRNFVHPRAASKDYTVRCSHIISNVRIEEESDGGLIVTSNFQCVMYYHDKQTLYAGRYRHELVDIDGQYKIRHKRVDLINCDGVHGSIIIYV
ncbi:MAG: aromatic-ring-hydroxylating dioxygenase subunit beta [Gammaproteobacteria bacterium]|nr:aromatic-ring-hydroxylating dioxygenase subunit beta [Gammaproteobacteria bacterium]MDH5618302.1 aromatic-ring-hydroxylating dioxygenase subunit beta [Gammaproteobacteria bacterium]